jgi:2,5-furandicarboxylate decarboxylase 1
MLEAVSSLRAAGHILEITHEVDPVGEMAAYVVQAAGWPILFQHVRGARFPVLYNLFGQAGWLADWMGVVPGGIVRALADACDHPAAAVPAGEAHDLIVDEPFDLARWLPIGQDYARQTRPSIQPAVVFVRDPESGLVNTSMHILTLNGPNRLVVHVQARHFGEIYGKWQRQGKPMPAAVVLGLDPAVWLAFGLNPEHPPGETEIASGLVGGLPMAACATVDLEVPAAAEIVLEGFVPPNERGPEPGPTGVYGPLHHGPVFEAQRLAAFSDSVSHGMLNAGRDHMNTLEWLKEAEILRHLRGVGLDGGISAVKVNPTDADWRFCAVAVDRDHASQARAVIDSLLRAHFLLGGVRRVVVVDEDVDLGSPRAIEWAMATRVRPETDLILVEAPHERGRDPLSRQGPVTKIGMDATVPPGKEADYARISVDWNGSVQLPRAVNPLPGTPPQLLRT